MRTLHLSLALVLIAAPAGAARAPDTGGTVAVHAAEVDADALSSALTSAPLLEPSSLRLGPVEAAAWPALSTGQRSRFLTDLAPEADGAVWVLTPAPRIGSESLSDSIRGCLAGWPGEALAAAEVDVRFDVTSSGVRVGLTAPVPAFPLLLEGCPGPAGAFAPDGDDRWLHRADAPGGRPYLDGVALVGSAARADLDLSPVSTAGEQLVAPWPDVWFLVPDEAARAADPWTLAADGGVARFHGDLAADLILAVRRGGRGASTRVLLPPGVAPDRPLSPAPTGDSPPLTLRPLPAGSPRLALLRSTADELTADLEARLALLLRARGWGVGDAGADTPTARIVQWRPPTADPGLATLLLAAEFGFPLTPRDTGGLLAADPADRASTALTVEQRWLDAGRAVPLLTAARTITVNPSLRGVRIRGDGLPVLDDAWWVDP